MVASMHIQEYSMDYSFLDSNKIVPVVVFNSVDEALPKLNALSRGGIKVAEITFRTACAKECIALASKECKDMLIGAGTVINAQQAEDAIDAGAKFIVSPGFSKAVFEVCAKRDIPLLPGIATPTDIIAVKECGLDIVKFFPAGAFGGVKMLKALAGPFPTLKFVPTGGVDAENMKEYLALPCVKAIGGSWMMKGDAEQIEKLSREAVKVLEEIK